MDPGPSRPRNPWTVEASQGDEDSEDVKVVLAARPLKVTLEAKTFNIVLAARPLKITLAAKPLKIALSNVLCLNLHCLLIYAHVLICIIC